MSKYRAKKVEIDGIIFDSKAEGEFYRLLKKMKVSGEVKKFALQPKFELQPKYRQKGTNKAVQAITYTADFDVTMADGTREIIDIKGFPTDVFRLKQKMFEYKYGVRLRLLHYTKRDGFRDWEEVQRERRKRKREAKKG